MSNEISVALPQKAVEIVKGVQSLNIIVVVDDKSNISAAENLKIVKSEYEEFISECEPIRKSLREPLDNFLSLIKWGKDYLENWMSSQKLQIGKYNQELLRKENERRRIEQETINLERNSQGKQSQDAIMLEKSKSNSEFVKTTVKEKSKGYITDKRIFIQSLIDTGKSEWINLIFDKVNESKLNDFCKSQNLNDKNGFPGLSVEMIPDVRIR